VIEWLNLPESERPTLIHVYFDEPDSAGHDAGPDADEVRTAVISVDETINNLTRRLLDEGLMGCINLILLSGHGMERINSSRNVVAMDYLGANFSDLFFDGPVARIQLNSTAAEEPDEDTKEAVDGIMAMMSCEKNENYLLYKKNLVPLRFHYAGSPRIGEVVIAGRPGARIFLTEEQKNSYQSNGDHGFDNRFENLLRVNASQNNGTNGALFNILRDPPELLETATFQSPPECEEVKQEINEIYKNCSEKIVSSLSATTSIESELCIIYFCDVIVHFHNSLKKTVIVEGILRKETWDVTPSLLTQPQASLLCTLRQYKFPFFSKRGIPHLISE
ncbi:unnamed protein product, partial [Gongylonema pulchrum]|uniref:NUC domain-containing protein n=1 Tax=Gongylonema pulchrum TaxID=637853 RepID=A0A183CV33_9BILA